jgi:5'-methylthioinosine phosphorylase
MSKYGVIGGTGLPEITGLVTTHQTSVKTPYGEPSSPLIYGLLGNKEVVFLSRRGKEAAIVAHKINYRANIWSLRDAGIQRIIATAAVAGIDDALNIGDVILPDQLIDYTYGREVSFDRVDANGCTESHISFTEPYSAELRDKILTISKETDFSLRTSGTYAVTQGPRFETRAEAARLARDGCHFVGMTGMPEASLARELGMEYACIALVIAKVGSASKPTPEQKTFIANRQEQVVKLISKIIQN